MSFQTSKASRLHSNSLRKEIKKEEEEEWSVALYVLNFLINKLTFLTISRRHLTCCTVEYCAALRMD